ncbi:MAG: YtxH domain-containing protein [Candidatus Abawacabacteria bacterium]|nr:YtxH domain-containing protein [Candidatus Abawacabacteria bacterium]
MSKRDKFIVGTIVGGAIGSILAVMFAPKSGKETREDIKKSSQELYVKGSKFSNKLSASTKNLIQRLWKKPPDKSV